MDGAPKVSNARHLFKSENLVHSTCEKDRTVFIGNKWVVSSYKIEGGDLGPVDVTVLLLLLLPLLLHRHCSDHLLLERNQSPIQLMSLESNRCSNCSAQAYLLPPNLCYSQTSKKTFRHLSVLILLLFLLPDNIKEQHGVFKRVPRLFGFGRQWLLDQNLQPIWI